ncbi:MAG: hypothetical protein SOY71_04325, partial [Dialister sp.]|nr:hypothetical protein [Dialister sp.]
TLGCASDDDGAKRYQNSAALYYFYAAPPFLILAKLSSTIKGRPAQGLTPNLPTTHSQRNTL